MRSESRPGHRRTAPRPARDDWGQGAASRPPGTACAERTRSAAAPTEPPQRLAERDQVIIVHPDQIGRPQHRPQGAREGLVDPRIAGEVAARKPDQRRPVVKQRPQHAIGVADVIFLVIAPRQVERGGGDLAGRHQLRLAARPLGDVAAEPEPHPAGLLERGADARPPARRGWPCPARSGRPGWRRRPADDRRRAPSPCRRAAGADRAGGASSGTIRWDMSAREETNLRTTPPATWSCNGWCRRVVPRDFSAPASHASAAATDGKA